MGKYWKYAGKRALTTLMNYVNEISAADTVNCVNPILKKCYRREKPRLNHSHVLVPPTRLNDRTSAMNQFYAAPNQVSSRELRLTGQEAKHASKVLRLKEGDSIRVTDGKGAIYEAVVRAVSKGELLADVHQKKTLSKPADVILCLGLIRKRDRLEFAVEKATELGISGIFLFEADHSEPFKVRVDRIEKAVLQAMKQSLRAFLPGVKLFASLDKLLNAVPVNAELIEAAQDGDGFTDIINNSTGERYLFVGPEGGLSIREKTLLQERNTRRVILAQYRLRAETAAIVMAERFRNIE